MKPRDVYNSTPISKSNDLYLIEYFLDGIDAGNEGLEHQTCVEVWEHFGPYIDGTRHASLYSVWFQKPSAGIADKQPVFICKTGGRPDYEYYQRFITDAALFGEMLGCLKTLEIRENIGDDENDFVGMNDDVSGLDEVYGYQITPADLGPIAHVRYGFLTRHLRPWKSERGWPYGKLTLKQKQQQRWQRIQQEAPTLMASDPECRNIARWAKAKKGTDEIIQKMTALMTQLLLDLDKE